MEALEIDPMEQHAPLPKPKLLILTEHGLSPEIKLISTANYQWMSQSNVLPHSKARPY